MSDVQPSDAAVSERLELIDVLAVGDGQDWPDFWENTHQQQIGETMYGAQADALLASSWLAQRLAAGLAVEYAALADEIEATLQKLRLTLVRPDDWLRGYTTGMSDAVGVVHAAAGGTP